MRLDDYESIVAEQYARHLSRITDETLRRFFDACFQTVVDQHNLYPAWACTSCLSAGRKTVDWGDTPDACPECSSRATYAIATFQGRAPRYGRVFTNALIHVARAGYEVRLVHTPGNTKTHDLEASPKVAIEVKGSARQLKYPDGQSRLTRAGLLRSDTEKKAFENARKYKMANPTGAFYIATNALPPRLVGHRGENVDGIFDVTKRSRLEGLLQEVKEAVNRS